MQERRRFVRLALPSIAVTYQPIDRQGDGVLEAAKDVSEGGIRFPVSEQLTHGARLELNLQLAGESVLIQAKAEVVWCARFHGDGPYEVGCRFTQIDPLDRGKLIRHIHEGLKERKPWAREP